MDAVRSLIADLTRPGNFFVAPALALEWQHVEADEVPWELFRGQLLDRKQCRQRRTFESWNIFVVAGGGRSAEPLLAVKRDAAARQLHVTRAVYCHAWEGFHAGGNVYESLEIQKWVRELVGTIDLDRFPDADDLGEELAAGCSRRSWAPAACRSPRSKPRCRNSRWGNSAS